MASSRIFYQEYHRLDDHRLTILGERLEVRNQNRIHPGTAFDHPVTLIAAL
jgi:hypothetical protein